MDRIHKGRFHATLHLSPGVLLKLNHSAAGAQSHTHRKHTYACYSLLGHGDLGLALRYWLRARLETKSIALSLVVTLWPTHTSICGKQYICSPDYARPGLLLQMVVASRNVTFDLTFHMEQEFKQVNEKAAKDAFVLEDRKKYKWGKKCVFACVAFITLTQFFDLDKCKCLHVKHISPG